MHFDEALHALEDDAHRRMINLFRDALKSATVINIGRPEVKDHFFKRVLHLIKRSGRTVFHTQSQLHFRRPADRRTHGPWIDLIQLPDFGG